jgi:hypothetical protein
MGTPPRSETPVPDLYPGKTFDPATRAIGEPFLLDSADLTTHGIVIGMTGSGKTGLSVCLIEELLKARIPVIVIDPKGDMANLAFAFDRLAPEQFAPWVDKDEARREGKTPAEVAQGAAATWTKGLGDWGIAPEDVAAYTKSFDMRVYTPGTAAGIPLNLIDSLAWPGLDFDENEEELRDEIDAIVSGLLSLVKIDADPVSSREYLLLFTLVERAWRQQHDLSLEGLIGQVANPPIEKIGALAVDTFYPAKARNELVFALNGLVASPRFEAWREGAQIDIEEWVRGDGGKPRLSVVYTAHLNDDERTFVTALILNRLKTWMRKQPGTSELRCLFYMDEIFGYFPPTANPPTKKPLLTLLKQARAYGVGILLSTQNPVDLDYKGLGNMGFWAIGRLQTTQDQERVRQGIEAALDDASGLDFGSLIAGVQKRVFLVHDIHRKRPELVHSRWAMSYLRGPVTRDEIRSLPEEMISWETAPAPARKKTANPAGEASHEEPEPAQEPGPPPLPAPLKPLFAKRWGGASADPHLYVKAAVRYRLGTQELPEEVRELAFRLADAETATALFEQVPVELFEAELGDRAPAGPIDYADVPAFVSREGAKGLERAIKSRLDDRLAMEVLYDAKTKQWGRPGEDPHSFAARIGTVQTEASKRKTLEERLAKKRADLSINEQELSGRRFEKWASVGTTILGNIGLFTKKSKKVNTGGIGSVLSKNRMEGTAAQRKAKIEGEIRDLEAQIEELAEVDPSRFETRTVKPAQTAVSLIRYDVVWVY